LLQKFIVLDALAVGIWLLP